MGGSFKQPSCERKERDKVVAWGGRSSKSVLFCSFLLFKIRERLENIYKLREKQRGKEEDRGAIVMTLSENKCPCPLTHWDSEYFF